MAPQPRKREAVQRRREARAHDAWFRGEVEQAVREADDPNVPRISDEEVRSRWRVARADIPKALRVLKRAGVGNRPMKGDDLGRGKKKTLKELLLDATACAEIPVPPRGRLRRRPPA